MAILRNLWVVWEKAYAAGSERPAADGGWKNSVRN